MHRTHSVPEVITPFEGLSFSTFPSLSFALSLQLLSSIFIYLSVYLSPPFNTRYNGRRSTTTTRPYKTQHRNRDENTGNTVIGSCVLLTTIVSSRRNVIITIVVESASERVSTMYYAPAASCVGRVTLRALCTHANRKRFSFHIGFHTFGCSAQQAPIPHGPTEYIFRNTTTVTDQDAKTGNVLLCYYLISRS